MSAEGKVCIITGAGTGVGKAAAIKLAEKGYAIVLVGRTASTLEGSKREVEAVGGTALSFPCDIGDYEAVQKMVKFTLQELGRVDVLINNAGIGGRYKTIADAKPDDVEEVIRVNLTGPIYCCQAVLSDMLSRKEGTIVNVTSLAAHNPGPLSGPAYCAAKAGMVNFNRYLNNELRNSGIRACCIIPGEIDTPILSSRLIPPSKAARATMMESDDVADAIVLAVTLPPRALVEEIVIRPTLMRNRSKEEPSIRPLLDL